MEPVAGGGPVGTAMIVAPELTGVAMRSWLGPFMGSKFGNGPESKTSYY